MIHTDEKGHGQPSRYPLNSLVLSYPLVSTSSICFSVTDLFSPMTGKCIRGTFLDNCYFWFNSDLIICSTSIKLLWRLLRCCWLNCSHQISQVSMNNRYGQEATGNGLSLLSGFDFCCSLWRLGKRQGGILNRKWQLDDIALTAGQGSWGELDYRGVRVVLWKCLTWIWLLVSCRCAVQLLRMD